MSASDKNGVPIELQGKGQALKEIQLQVTPLGPCLGATCHSLGHLVQLVNMS